MAQGLLNLNFRISIKSQPGMHVLPVDLIYICNTLLFILNQVLKVELWVIFYKIVFHNMKWLLVVENK